MRNRPLNTLNLTTPHGINTRPEERIGMYYYARPLPQFIPQWSRAQHHALVTERACQINPRLPLGETANPTEQIHWENMRRSLERRLQVAQERGDEQLVSLLHQEFAALQR